MKRRTTGGTVVACSLAGSGSLADVLLPVRQGSCKSYCTAMTFDNMPPPIRRTAIRYLEKRK
jgi:hypothetical protein